MVAHLMTIRQAVKGAAAFSKTISILQLIADSEQPITSAELVKKTGMPRPTMRRILKALVAEDMAELRSDKTYALGPRNVELARKTVAQNSLLRTVDTDLAQLSAEVEATVFLGIPSGNEFIIIAGEGDPQVQVGTIAQIHACAIAKSYLASVAPERREQIIASTKMHTPISPDQIRAELEKVAADGYAASTNHTERETKLVSKLTQYRDRINEKLQQSKYLQPVGSFWTAGTYSALLIVV